MNTRFVPFVVLVGCVAMAVAGCSTKAWYEGMRLRAQNDCRSQPSGEAEQCLSRVNTMTYEDYERKRLGPPAP
jgi:hypothetical protein